MPVSSVHQDLRTRLPEDDAVPGRDQALGRGGGGGAAATQPCGRSDVQPPEGLSSLSGL